MNFVLIPVKKYSAKNQTTTNCEQQDLYSTPVIIDAAKDISSADAKHCGASTAFSFDTNNLHHKNFFMKHFFTLRQISKLSVTANKVRRPFIHSLRRTVSCLMIGLFVLMGKVGWGQTNTRYNDGYLTVFKTTSGAALANTGTAIVMEEYNTTTANQSAPNFSVAIPSASGNKLVVSGSATAAGQISRSENGRYILLPGYNALVGDANATFNTNAAVRTLNGSGTVGAGITGANYSSGNNNLRGATSDDLTNYWMTGNGIGIITTSNGTTLTTVSTTSTNNRAAFIFNGQLFLTTGAGTQGIYSVGSGKPINTGNTSVRLFAPANTDVYGFALSPDGATIFYVGATTGGGTAGIYRSTFNGSVWTVGTQIAALSGYTGIAVDWSAYSFSTTGANGARIFASNASTIIAASDNGTGTLTTTTLRTEPTPANNAFRGLSFSPIKQTVSKGASTPATGSISTSANDVVLFQFNLTADEGNSTLKKVIVKQNGTATIGAGNNISNFRLIDDANNNGLFDGGETVLSTGTVAGSDITFGSVSLSTYITEGSGKNFLVVGNVGATGGGNTFIPTIVSNKSLNSVNYTTNLVNAGGSWVNIGATAPTGNTLTIAAACITPIIQASNITASSITTTSMHVSWTNGNGANRVLVMNTTNSFTDPVDGPEFLGNNPVYTSGEQVMYVGTDNFWDISGLTAGTQYYFRVYEYNCSAPNTKYNITTATNNPNPATTSSLPTVDLSVNTNSASEAAATIVTVTATASSPVSGNQTVSVAVTGAGITAGDYTLSNTTITILNGNTTGLVTFTIVNDLLVEGTETATLTISTPSSGIALGTTLSQNVIITDNDIAPLVNLSVSPAIGTEAAATIVTVTATASAPVAGDQTVSLAVASGGGTTITAGDYNLSNTTITILDGQSTGSVTFTIVDDGVAEGPEIATLTISSPSAGIALGATTSRNINIVDNDIPLMRITEFMHTGSEFVEFTNIGNAAINMTGWSFDDASRTSGSFSLTGFGIVQPGESVIMSEVTESSFRTTWGLCNGIKIVGGNNQNLSSTADEMNLYNASSVLVDRITYSTTTGPNASGASAWVSAAGLGANLHSEWALSTIADAEGSFGSVSPTGFTGSPGKSSRATVVYDPCPVVNGAPTIVINTAATTNFLDGGAASSPTSPFAVSGVISDPTDPALNFGIDFTIGDDVTPVNSLTVTVASGNTSVVPNANLNLTGSGASRNLKITPAGVGYATITVSVFDGTNTTNYVLSYAASAASVNTSTTRFHTGTSDASTAQAVDANNMFVADDENNVIRLYNRQNSGLPVYGFDVTSNLGLTDLSNLEVDIEGSVQIGNRIYWIGSQGNNKNGLLRPNRTRLFATDVTGTGASSTLSYVGRYDNLRTDLLNWDASNGHGLGANYFGFVASAAAGVIPEAPGGVGFNLEGLTVAPDGVTGYLSFRAPIEPVSSRTKALIVPLTNFTSLVSGNPAAGPATFGTPILLDLGGRGIREIKRNAAGQYLIVAGPFDDASTAFRLYTWTGNASDAPLLHTADLTALNSGGSFESIVEMPVSLTAGSQVQLLVDNGDTKYYDAITIAKDLPNNNHKKFRSEIITLGCTTSEINVQGNSNTIADGDITPSLTDHTDFGNVIAGDNLVRTYTIQNTGTTNLTVSSIAISGTNATMFVAGALTPASPIPAGGSATFTVTFTPASTGLKNATVTINSDDCDETVYDFAIRGNAVFDCDIATSPITVVNAANTATITSICVGQQANFKFSITNAGLSPTCIIPANSVTAVFDFPTIAGPVKPYIYNGPASFVSGFFTWTYNSIDEVLEGTNTTAIPTGAGDFNILVPVIGNAAGTGNSNVNLSQSGATSDDVGNNTANALLTVNAFPVVTCTASFAVCPGSAVITLSSLAGISPAGGTFTGAGVIANQFDPVLAGNGPHIITYTYTNASGCTGTCSFTITVEDVTAPVVSGCPGNITVNTGAGNALCSQTATWTPPTSTDNCSTVTVVSNHNPGDVFPAGTTTVTYTFTDAANNSSPCSFTVTVIDNTAPVVGGCPGNITVNTGVGNTLCSQTATWTAPTAIDNCTAVTVVSNHNPGDVFPAGATTVTYTFTDAANNSSVCSFTVTVVDNTPPSFGFCPSPVFNAPVNSAGCLASVATVQPTVTDNCSLSKLTWALTGATTGTSSNTGINYLPSPYLFNTGLTTVTYTGTDASNNTSTCTFTVSVVNTLAGSISGTATVLLHPSNTSPITFSGSGGTLPYSFTYKVNGGPDQVINTILSNTTAVVQQSNAVAGTFIYTLVSITDANGCTVTLPPNTTAIITVLNSRPDLYSEVSRPLNTQFINGQLKEGYVTISNAATDPTTGTITFRISLVSNFNLVIGDATTNSAGSPVNNSDWNITLTPGLYYTLTSKPGVVINGSSASSKIGYTLTATGSANSQGIMTVTIINGTGGSSLLNGDSNNTNNQSVKLFTIN